MTGGLGTYLTAIEHLRPWQVFLGGIYGAAGGLLVVGAYRRSHPHLAGFVMGFAVGFLAGAWANRK